MGIVVPQRGTLIAPPAPAVPGLPPMSAPPAPALEPPFPAWGGPPALGEPPGFGEPPRVGVPPASEPAVLGSAPPTAGLPAPRPVPPSLPVRAPAAEPPAAEPPAAEPPPAVRRPPREVLPACPAPPLPWPSESSSPKHRIQSSATQVVSHGRRDGVKLRLAIEHRESRCTSASRLITESVFSLGWSRC
jgi:hypothetical protein